MTASIFGGIGLGTHSFDRTTGSTRSITATLGNQQGTGAATVQVCQILSISYGSGSGTHAPPLLGSGMFGNNGGPFKLLRAGAPMPPEERSAVPIGGAPPAVLVGATESDYRAWSGTIGLTAGGELLRSDRFTMIPAVSLAFAHHHGELAASSGAAPRTYTYGLLGLTLGFVFNDVLAIRPTMGLPLGTSGARPIIGLGVMLAPGAR